MSRMLVLLGLMTVIYSTNVCGSDAKLKLVHVLFRHADRTPDLVETYPNDPYGNYTYFPVGRGGLTNLGKRREYHLGKVLRQRYGDFIGPIYYPELIEARSTGYDRTKMCLQLVLSALFPPAPIQKWNKRLNWQPIPTDYRPTNRDHLLFPIYCSQYVDESNRISATPEMLGKVAKLDGLRKKMEMHTGRDDLTILNLHRIYNLFISQDSLHLKLPKWVSEFYPDGELYNATILAYEMMSYNDKLKRLYGGMLLNQILNDTVKSRDGTLEERKKLFLYSAHEVNIAGMQLTLGTWKPHIPQYSSAMIFEVSEKHNQYFMKVLYYKGIPSETVTQTIPGCSELCPLDKFIELLKPVTATEDERKCR